MITSNYQILPFKFFPSRRLEEVFTLINRAWNKAHSYYMKEKKHDRYSTIEALENEVKKSHLFVLYDIRKDRFVGSVQFSRTYEKVHAYFGTLCISDEIAGQGFGEKLIQSVEKTAKELGHTRLFILVIACAEKLRSFYEKMGFRLTGKVVLRERSFIERVNDFYKTKVYFQEMCKDLKLQSKL
jgi:N-acetylglutamate synthase-like GNAT family acetyltransferase